MFEPLQTLFPKVTSTYDVVSSLEVTLIHLKNVCVYDYVFPKYEVVDLTELETNSPQSARFKITAAKAFTFYVLVTGVLEKINDFEVRVTYDMRVSEGQFSIFRFFALAFPVFFGVVFLKTFLPHALLFIILPPTALFIAIRQTKAFIEELNARLQKL